MSVCVYMCVCVCVCVCMCECPPTHARKLFRAGSATMIIRTQMYGEKSHFYGGTIKSEDAPTPEHLHFLPLCNTTTSSVHSPIHAIHFH